MPMSMTPRPSIGIAIRVAATWLRSQTTSTVVPRGVVSERRTGAYRYDDAPEPTQHRHFHSLNRGRERRSPSPPSEPAVQFSRDGLSSQLFPHRDWRANL